MSDEMLLGVLEMPYELAMTGEVSSFQYHARGQQAANLLRKLRRVEDRYNWLANRVLDCTYGDNGGQGEGIGWKVTRVYADRILMYGDSVDQAIDAQIAKGSRK
jgi:hypothetical protein